MNTLKEVILKKLIFSNRTILHIARIYFREFASSKYFAGIFLLKNLFSVISLDFDGFLNKKDIMHTQWCICIFFFVISLKKIWKFGYLVFFAGINFRKIAQNSPKLLLLIMHAVTEFELLRSTHYFTKLSFQKDF